MIGCLRRVYAGTLACCVWRERISGTGWLATAIALVEYSSNGSAFLITCHRARLPIFWSVIQPWHGVFVSRVHSWVFSRSRAGPGDTSEEAGAQNRLEGCRPCDPGTRF